MQRAATSAYKKEVPPTQKIRIRHGKRFFSAKMHALPAPPAWGSADKKSRPQPFAGCGREIRYHVLPSQGKISASKDKSRETGYLLWRGNDSLRETKHLARCKSGLLLRAAAHDVQKLVGDGLLARLVVGERKLAQKVVGVVGGKLHRHHAGGVLARQAVKQSCEEL